MSALSVKKTNKYRGEYIRRWLDKMVVDWDYPIYKKLLGILVIEDLDTLCLKVTCQYWPSCKSRPREYFISLTRRDTGEVLFS